MINLVFDTVTKCGPGDKLTTLSLNVVYPVVNFVVKFRNVMLLFLLNICGKKQNFIWKNIFGKFNCTTIQTMYVLKACFEGVDMIFCFNSVLIMFHFCVKYCITFPLTSCSLLPWFVIINHLLVLGENFFKYIIDYDSIKHFFSKLRKWTVLTVEIVNCIWL